MQADTPNKDLLAITSRWTAAVRARESERADRLFNDPWAAALAGKEGVAWLERMSAGAGGGSADFQVIRTRFFDDFLLHTTAQHDIRQVVLVAAGMDTRGFRLHWPEGTRLFELDQPQVVEFKDRVLSSAEAKPFCWRQAIGVDLEGSWADALRAAGFDASQRSVWLLEGLLFYLPEASALKLLDIVSEMAVAESWLGLDLVSRDMLTSPWTRSWIEALDRAGVPWHFATDEPEALLAERGWTATVIQLGEEGANFGRWPYPVAPRSTPGFPRSFLVTARRSRG